MFQSYLPHPFLTCYSEGSLPQPQQIIIYNSVAFLVNRCNERSLPSTAHEIGVACYNPHNNNWRNFKFSHSTCFPAKSVHSFYHTNKREAYVTFHCFCATRYFKTPKELKLSSSEFTSAVIMDSGVLWVVTPFNLVDFNSNKSPTRSNNFSSLLFWRLFTAQHVSGVLMPIIRSSTTTVAASGFTFVSWW